MGYLDPGPHPPPPTRSAVIVPIPAADPILATHRDRLDRAASWGVPAHVTVLYPFAAPADLDAELVRTLAEAVRSVAAFDCTFASTGWFGEDVLWLAPEPDAPFRALTSAVWTAFPQYPPYAGAYDDAVAHMTVAEARFGTKAELDAVESAVRPALPLAARIDHAVLIAGSDVERSWRVLHRFPLGEREFTIAS